MLFLLFSLKHLGSQIRKCNQKALSQRKLAKSFTFAANFSSSCISKSVFSFWNSCQLSKNCSCVISWLALVTYLWKTSYIMSVILSLRFHQFALFHYSNSLYGNSWMEAKLQLMKNFLHIMPTKPFATETEISDCGG